MSDLIVNNATMYVLDELNGKNVVSQISVVEDVSFNVALNKTDVTTTSGTVLTSITDPLASVTGVLYSPGNMANLELLFRGAVSNSTYDGVTTEAGFETTIKFGAAGDSVVLPGFNGDKTAVTINSVVLTSNNATTYTVTTDYTVAADPTGVTLITQVAGGSIPLDTEVTVNYDFTPLQGSVLQSSSTGVLKSRTVILRETPDCDDDTKYRMIIIPGVVATTDLNLSFLDVTTDNASPNVLNFTLEQQSVEKCAAGNEWIIYDTTV